MRYARRVLITRRGQAALALSIATAATLAVLGLNHWMAPTPKTVSLAMLPPGKTVNITVEKLCVPGYTATVRPPDAYTNKLKAQQMKQLHLPGTMSDYREDHFVSLGLGGDPTSPDNLWPQPTAQSFQKDRAEDRLHKAVCAGQLSLADAQAQIKDPKNWHG